VKRIDVDRARKLIERGATILDVLPEPTHRKNHIPGALSRPLATMTEAAMSDLARSKPVVVYCFDQRCDLSARASARLVQMGFTAVHDLIGGRAAWTLLGLPTEGSEGDRRRVAEFLDEADTVAGGATIASMPTRSSEDPVAVIDDAGVLLGAVDRAAASLDPTTPVTQAMVPAPGTIRPDVTIDDALEQLRHDGLPYTFVTTARGELLGLLHVDAHV
jgi:rhodanese-related sulfurtransferase